MFPIRFRTAAILAAIALPILLFGCQKGVPHVVVATPHPSAPASSHALYFLDSTRAGLTKPPYDYSGQHFHLNAADDPHITVTVTCYGADQTNYLAGAYQITVDLYKGGVLQQASVALAQCKPGNPSTSSGDFAVKYTGRDYYLVIHAGGPWTVEVDPQ